MNINLTFATLKVAVSSDKRRFLENKGVKILEIS